jgi:hypothetical protein
MYDRRMRALRRTCIFVLVVAIAACGGGGGNGDGPPGDDAPPRIDGPPPADAPPAGTPLVDRITVASVTTPAGALAGDSNWRIWGTGSLRVAPVFTVPHVGCGTLVGYTTGGGTTTARVARLDAQDQLITTYDLGPYILRGLAAEPDGSFAALLWDTQPDPASLHVQHFADDGTPGWSASLDDDLAMPDDFGIGESRLEYGDGRYGAYFHVHGISGFAKGHEGDAFHWVDAASGAHTVGWDWGCSHSMSELIRYNPANSEFLSACVTDCFPGTSGDFGASSIGGVYLDRSRKIIDVDAGCNGSVAGELGGMALASPGWKLVFNAHQNAATPGQGSYNPSTMNQDIGFASVGGDGQPAGGVTWLTTTPGNEANSALARWRPAGDTDEQYVVGWSAGGDHFLGRISPSGAFLEGPVDVSSQVSWGERDDPFRPHANDDVIWAWFDSAGSTTLRVARLRAGGVCTD